MSGDILIEYLPVLIFMGLAFFMAFAAMVLSLILGRRNPYKAKNAPYECGFEPFSDARAPFDVRFYLVGILFIFRYRSRLSLSVGGCFEGNRLGGLCGRDGFPWRFDGWLCL